MYKYRIDLDFETLYTRVYTFYRNTYVSSDDFRLIYYHLLNDLIHASMNV